MLLLQHRHSFRFAWDQLQKHAMLLWMIAPPGGQSTQKGFYVGSKLHLILSSVDQFSLPMRWSIFSKLGGSSIDPFLIIFFCFFLGLHRYHKFEACLFLHISGFIIQNHFGSSCLMAETFLKEFLEISKSTYQFLELFNGWIMCLSPHFFKHVFALHGSPWHHPKPFHFGWIQDFRKNELPKITTRQHLDSFRMTYCMFFWAYLSNLFIHKEKTIYIYIYTLPSNPKPSWGFFKLSLQNNTSSFGPKPSLFLPPFQRSGSLGPVGQRVGEWGGGIHNLGI